jgi:hypothetical protein
MTQAGVEQAQKSEYRKGYVMKIAFFIICERPSNSTILFAEKLAELLPNVVLVTDVRSDIKLLKAELCFVDDGEARSAGFCNSSPLISKTPIAWDKALYLMRKRYYDYGWFCEDDVLFTSAEAASELVTRYVGSGDDLLCQQFFTYNDLPGWANWKHGHNFSKNWLSGGFFPLCRLSAKLSNAIEEHIAGVGSLTFIETMLPSLAKQHKLQTSAMPELNLNAFRHDPPLTRSEIIALAYLAKVNIFHPVKNNDLRFEIISGERSAKLTLREFFLAGPIIAKRWMHRGKRRIRERTKRSFKR